MLFYALIAALPGLALAAPAQIEVRADPKSTYAGTCTFYESTTYAGFNGIATVVTYSSSCKNAASAGPYVTKECSIVNFIFLDCDNADTYTTCVTATSNKAVQVTCATPTFAAYPVSVPATTTTTMTSIQYTSLPTSLFPSSTSSSSSLTTRSTGLQTSSSSGSSTSSISRIGTTTSMPTSTSTRSSSSAAQVISSIPGFNFGDLVSSILNQATSTATNHQISLPTTKITSIPSILTVSVPTFSLPTVSLSTVSLPTVSLPTVSLPTVSLPTVSLPTVSLPTVSLPTVTLPLSTSIPTLSLLSSTLIKSLSTTSLPTISLPTVKLPTLSLPTSLSATLSVPTTTLRLSTLIATSSLLPSSLPTISCFADNIAGAGRTFLGASKSSSGMTNKVCQTFCNNLGFAYSGTEQAQGCYCSRIAPAVISTGCNMACTGNPAEICGGVNALSVSYNDVVGAKFSQLQSLAITYTPYGCFSDNYPNRVLNGASTTSSSMTPEICAAFCNNAGYLIAGVEYNSECYCGNYIVTDSMNFGVQASGCTYPCSGNSQELCGGSNVLNIYAYTNSLYDVTASITPASAFNFIPAPYSASGYTYTACYADSASRILSIQMGNVNSVEQCVASCSNAGYAFAGVEYYTQCFCGNTILYNAAQMDPVNCNFTCTGSPTENCGGSYAMQIYSGIPSFQRPSIPASASGYTNTYNYVDTFVDSISARILPYQQSLSSTTVESCVMACSALRYPYAGLEYSTQCFCGSSILYSPAGGLTPTMTCAGNTTEYCGGPDAMQVYSATTTAAPSSGSSTSSQQFTAANANGQCASDYEPGNNNVRTLSGAMTTSNSMTPAVCASFCSAYRFYGVEYSLECYCGNSIAASSIVSSSCINTCSGNNNLICGGSWAMNIYTNPNYVSGT